jgi:hypothetical protein
MREHVGEFWGHCLVDTAQDCNGPRPQERRGPLFLKDAAQAADVVGAFLFPLERQLQLALVRQLFSGFALDSIEHRAARLPSHANHGKWTCPLYGRASCRMVINLLADFEFMGGSFHPAV